MLTSDQGAGSVKAEELRGDPQPTREQLACRPALGWQAPKFWNTFAVEPPVDEAVLALVSAGLIYFGNLPQVTMARREVSIMLGADDAGAIELR
jgi:hypothetical protein